MPPPGKKRSKSLLRSELRGLVRGLPPAVRRRKSLAITRKIASSEAYHRAAHILAYMPLPDEVDTRPLIRRALEDGKAVYLPRIEKAGLGCYRVRRIEPGLLIRNTFGILEPAARRSLRRTPGRMSLILVPGLGFTPGGARLGRGGGYYDRLLARLRKPFRMGVAFSEQLRDRLPTECHDARMDCVITD